MLQANERWDGGFVVDKITGQVVATTNRTGARWSGGFLRDSDGRLVVTGA